MGIKKTLKSIGADVLDVLGEVKDLTALSYKHGDQLTTLERQLTPPKPLTFSQSLGRMGKVFAAGFSTGLEGPTVTPEAPTLYSMVKEVYTRTQNEFSPMLKDRVEVIASGLRDANTALEGLSKQRHADHNYLSRQLVTVHNKLKDLDTQLAKAPNVSTELAGMNNSLAKISTETAKLPKLYRYAESASDGVQMLNASQIIYNQALEEMLSALKSQNQTNTQLLTALDGIGELQRMYGGQTTLAHDDAIDRLERIESQLQPQKVYARELDKIDDRLTILDGNIQTTGKMLSDLSDRMVVANLIEPEVGL